MLDDQELTEKTFVMWDLIHDRTHMRGDLPFDPFMIKQRMPYFLYSLEELRCDLTAFRECVALERDLMEPFSIGVAAHADPVRDAQAGPARAVRGDLRPDLPVRDHRDARAQLRRGRRQLLFAWLHQRGVLHWTDTSLAFDWQNVPAAVVELSDAIDELYWHSIDRPKMAHWLAAYELVRATLTPEPGIGVGARPSGRDARRRPEGVHRRGAGRRVPAVDVLRGAREEDAARDRVDGGIRATDG